MASAERTMIRLLSSNSMPKYVHSLECGFHLYPRHRMAYALFREAASSEGSDTMTESEPDQALTCRHSLKESAVLLLLLQ